MTQLEINTLNLTKETWNSFLELPLQHNDDIQEFRFHIHALQNIILAREGARALSNDVPGSQTEMMPRQIKSI